MTRKRRLTIPRTSVAYHEAGHVVCFYLLTGYVYGAEIYDGVQDGAHGRAYYRGGPDGIVIPRGEEWLGLAIMASAIAGPYAQARYSHRNFDAIMGDDGLSDMRSVDAVIDCLGWDSAMYGPCWRMARKVIAAHWSAVQAVAVVLLKRGWIGGHEIARIVHPLPHKLPKPVRGEGEHPLVSDTTFRLFRSVRGAT